MASFRFRVIAETAAIKLAGRDFTRAGKQAEDALGKANRESRKATSAQEKLAQRVKVVGDRLQRLGSLGNVMTGLVTAGRALIDIYTRLARTLADFSRHALTSAQRMEDMALSYAAIYDIDLKGGRAAFDRMLEVSKVLPVTTEEYGKALQTLAAFNIADTWEEEQQFLLAMIGASKSLNVELDRVRRAIISLEREPLLNLGVRIDRRGNHARILFRGVVHELEYTENIIRRKLIELFGQEFEEAVTRSRNVITTLRAELSSLNTQLDIAIYDQLEPRIKSLSRAFLDWLEVNREFIAIEIAERFNKLLFIAEELVPVFKILASAILAPIDLLLDLTVLAVQGLQDMYKWIKDLIAPFQDWLDQLREAVPLIDRIASFIGRGADFVGETVGAVGGIREGIRERANETAGTLAPIVVSADPNINRIRDLVDEQFGQAFIESLSKSIGQGGASGLQTVLADAITGERGLLKTFRDGGKIVSDYIREGFAEGIAKNVSDVFQKSLTDISGNALEPLRQSLFGNPDLVGPQNPLGSRVSDFLSSPRGQAAIGAVGGGLTLASGVATGDPLTGALGGAALGASLGTIVPGIGNVIGGVIGGIVGALGGIFGGGGRKDPFIRLRLVEDQASEFANSAGQVVQLTYRGIDVARRELLNSLYDVLDSTRESVISIFEQGPLSARQAATSAFGRVRYSLDEIYDFEAVGQEAAKEFESFLKGVAGITIADFEPAFEAYAATLGIGLEAIGRIITEPLEELRGLTGVAAERAGEAFLEEIQFYAQAFELTQRETGIAKLTRDITDLSKVLGIELPSSTDDARAALEEIIEAGNVSEQTVADFDALINSLEELSAETRRLTEITRRETGIAKLAADVTNLSQSLGFGFIPSVEGAQVALEGLIEAGTLSEDAARDFETLISALRELPAAIGAAINSTASEIAQIQSLLGRSNENVIEALRSNISSLERSLDSLSESDLAGQERLLGEIGNSIQQIVSLEQQQQQTLEQISRQRIEGLQEELKGVEALLSAQERASQALLDLQGGQFSPLSGGERLLGIQGQISGLEQSLSGATGIEAAEITNQLTALYTQLIEQAGSIFGAGSLGVSDVFAQAEARLADLAEGREDLESQIITIEEAILLESQRQADLTEETNRLLERYLSRLEDRLSNLQTVQSSTSVGTPTQSVTSQPTEDTRPIVGFVTRASGSLTLEEKLKELRENNPHGRIIYDPTGELRERYRRTGKI